MRAAGCVQRASAANAARRSAAARATSCGRGGAGARRRAGRGAAEASVEGRGPLSEVVGWRCLPPGSRSVGAASRRLTFGGTGRAHGSGAFDAGRCVRHSDVAHRSVGCIREQPCTCCDCHWRRSGHMHRALVAAAAGSRQTASGPARAAARFSARTRASAADAFGAHAHARFPSQDDDDAYARSYIYIYIHT